MSDGVGDITTFGNLVKVFVFDGAGDMATFGNLVKVGVDCCNPELHPHKKRIRKKEMSLPITVS